MRIQFYPTTDLEAKLNQESTRLGINISVLVVDALNDYYGLKLPNTKTEAELEIKVLDEIEKFVNNPKNANTEFDLNMASTTYNQISMTYTGKPKIVKARIGKAFAKKVGKAFDEKVGKAFDKKVGKAFDEKVGVDPFHKVEQLLLNGKPKRSVGNRAALYIVRTGDANGQESSDRKIQ